MRLFRPCFFAGWLYPEAIFRIKTEEKFLYLTFDDGPHPESTLPLLDILSEKNIKALFFCDGRAAERYPELVDLIRSRGHLIGNHGYLHLDGWKTSTENYAADVSKAESFVSSRLFRPPYGRMKRRQYKLLKDRFKIVLWDIMPYDFDKDFGSDRALDVLVKKIRPGSIIVLHDNATSAAVKILPGFIDFASGNGYRFKLTEF
jgi:peptidoglycan-N-acetylglucosamine deacetylase